MMCENCLHAAVLYYGTSCYQTYSGRDFAGFTSLYVNFIALSKTIKEGLFKLII